MIFNLKKQIYIIFITSYINSKPNIYLYKQVFIDK